MKLDPKGLEAAREQPGTNHDGIIRAYLAALTPAEVGGLVERLWKLRYDNDSQLFQHEIAELEEAASLIQSQAARIAELEAVLRTTRTLVSEAALTGFNCHDGKWAEQLYANQAAISKAVEPTRALLNGERKG